MQEEAEAAGEALAALDTTDIYQGLAMAREQANGFVSVLSKLGDGEGRLRWRSFVTREELAEVLYRGLGPAAQA